MREEQTLRLCAGGVDVIAELLGLFRVSPFFSECYLFPFSSSRGRKKCPLVNLEKVLSLSLSLSSLGLTRDTPNQSPWQKFAVDFEECCAQVRGIRCSDVPAGKV